MDYWSAAKNPKDAEVKTSIKASFKLLFVARQPMIEVAGKERRARAPAEIPSSF